MTAMLRRTARLTTTPHALSLLPRRMVRAPGSQTALWSSRLLSSGAASADPERTEPVVRMSVVDELERLEHESPWWKATLLRLAGTFSDAQRQCAAGADMYMRVLEGYTVMDSDFFAATKGALEDRYLVRFQLIGLHCWMCHARLRRESKESYDTLFREMMEKVWAQAELDLHRNHDFGFVQAPHHRTSHCSVPTHRARPFVPSHLAPCPSHVSSFSRRPVSPHLNPPVPSVV